MIVVFFALAKMGFSHLPFKSIQGGQIASAPVSGRGRTGFLQGLVLVKNEAKTERDHMLRVIGELKVKNDF